MQQITVSRVVALATPVLAAAGGLVAAEAARYGLHVPAADVTAIFVTGSASATGAALKWLHGRAQFEARAADLEHEAIAAVGDVADAVESPPPPLAGQAVDPDAAKAAAEAEAQKIIAEARSTAEAEAQKIVSDAASRLEQLAPAAPFPADPQAPAAPAEQPGE